MSSDGQHHHIIPLGTYFKVLGVLLVFTAITVIVSRFNFGEWNTVIAMLIASIKAGFVLAIFMHLKYDDKMYLVCFGTAVFFIVVMYFFCWLDIYTRIFQSGIL